MLVRDLITSLLEFDLDAEVEVIVDTNEGQDNCDFDLEEIPTMTVQKYVQLIAKPDGQVLVDEENYQSLKDEKSDLENKVADLENAMEEMERQIYELEEQK
ncbi:hypothetical protein [Psychrobacillus sp. FSL K6-1267]|uniref:hypothetical protein n=1 Tax=Psychrobacillus sp. FSL K6-1267 TaxID=2921543 RepID=UPI0030FA0CAB